MKKVILLLSTLITLTLPTTVFADMIPSFPLSSIPTSQIYSGSNTLAQAIMNFFIWLIIGMGTTIFTELIIALIYAFVYKTVNEKFFLSVIKANLISIPIFWVFIALSEYLWGVFHLAGTLPLLMLLLIIFGEICVVVFEANFIYKLNLGSISRTQAYTLSIMMNLVSMTIGNILVIFYMVILPILGILLATYLIYKIFI